MGPNIPIPKGKCWQDFLKVTENKKQLFEFLSEELCAISKDDDYLLFSTKGDYVLSNREYDLSTISPCTQEEADTRIIKHFHHAAEEGHRIGYGRTVDTDVVVNAVNMFSKTQLDELWIGYGTGSNYRDIPIHNICHALGPQVCNAILLFHTFTGYDQTSAFKSIGKKKAWNAWEQLGDPLTETFIDLTNDPIGFDIDSPQMDIIQKFTVLMYDTKCDSEKVNDARRYLFTNKLKPLESIPPTLHSLYQHTKRSINAANYCSQALLNKPVILSYSDFGFVWNERLNYWMPHWSDLPDVSKCVLLRSCSCKVACKGNCSCARKPMKCTSLCACQGMCINNEQFD